MLTLSLVDRIELNFKLNFAYIVSYSDLRDRFYYHIIFKHILFYIIMLISEKINHRHSYRIFISEKTIYIGSTFHC